MPGATAVLRWARAGVLCVVIGGMARAEEAPIRFVDVAADVGILFHHENDATDQKQLPETYGSGSAFFDYDGDGDLDLYLVNSGSLNAGRGTAWNRLYRNDCSVFADVSEAVGARGGGYGMGAVAADADNDGDADLYLSNWGADIFYRNQGDGTFVDETGRTGLGNADWGSSAAFLDSDLDGDLDLFVANYVHFKEGEQPWCGRRDLDLRFYCDPRQFAPALDRLYRNREDGTFEDIGLEAGIVHRGNGLGVVSSDWDGDGDADLYVANDMTPNFFYVNDGKGRFQENGLLSGTALSADGVALAGMGVDTGDVDGDGDLDLFVTNYQLENNNLYRNDGTVFSEVSFRSGIGEISLNYLGFGTGFFDYDNDGWLDLFVANGHVHNNIQAYDAVVTYAQRAQVFRNDGTGHFAEQMAGPALWEHYVGRGSAFGDYDGDGDLDIALVNCGRRMALLQNQGGNGNNWLQISLAGRRSNRDGVGAKIYVTAGEATSFQEVKVGSGYLSSSQMAPHFGLGASAVVDRLEIRWPSGTGQVFEQVAVNQRLRIVEPGGD